VRPHPVLAVQDCVLSPAPFARVSVGDEVVEEPSTLDDLILKCVGIDVELGRSVGPQFLVEQRRVVTEQSAGGVENLFRASAVLVEHDRPLDSILPCESSEDLGIGASPRKDRLLVVPDRKEIAVRLGQVSENRELGGVEILELIHQQVIPPGSDLGGHRSMFVEKTSRRVHQIVEIEHVLAPQLRHVLAEQHLVSLR
jgi:hypothetical protein